MNTQNKPHSNKNVLIGSIIIGFGILLLIDKVSIFNPFRILTWEIILIIIGVVIGIKTNFKHAASWIMIMIGSIFFVNNHIFHVPFARVIIFPMTLIIIGILIVSRGRKKHTPPVYTERPDAEIKVSSPVTYGFENTQSEKDRYDSKEQSYKGDFAHEEHVELQSYFGGNKHIVYSQTLKTVSGTIIFGGSTLVLTQADFKRLLVIDLMVIAGGIEIRMPSNWYVKNETTVIMGGLDDKRLMYNTIPDPDKMVIIRGSVFMGGVEIKN